MAAAFFLECMGRDGNEPPPPSSNSYLPTPDHIGYPRVMSTERRALLAYTLPFVLFMAGLVAVSVARTLGITTFAGIPLDPMYWIYPIQTVACAAALLWFWRCYDEGAGTAGKLLIGAVVGLVIFGLWVAPQELVHQARRTEGFDPGVVSGMSPWMRKLPSSPV